MTKMKKKKVPFTPSKRQQEKRIATSNNDETVLDISKEIQVITERTMQDPQLCQCTASVTIPSQQEYRYHPNAWSSLSSKVMTANKRLPEVILQWKECIGNEEEIFVVARRAVELTKHWFVDDDDKDDDDDGDDEESSVTSPMFRILNLVSSMTSFVKYCRSNLDTAGNHNKIVSYKLKLDVMYGTTATRCPLWHADNVPIRWIQTYTGPGCQYLWEDPTKKPNPFLERVRMTDNEREGSLYGPQWKETLVQMSSVPISQSPTGAPIMFIGRKWYQHATKEKHGTTTEQMEVAMSDDDDDDDEADDDVQDYSITVESDLKKNNNNETKNAAQYHYFHPVLHRSPQNVPSIQGRVLMNLDVVMIGGGNGGNGGSSNHPNPSQFPPHADHSNCGDTCHHQQQGDDTTKTKTKTTTNTSTTKQNKQKKQKSWFQKKW